MSYSNYEQVVVVDGHELLGVQAVDGNYSISEKPIKVAGAGMVDAVVDSPLQGNFNITRKMVCADPFLEKNILGKYEYDEKEFSGAILYDNQTKGFSFTRARLASYSVSCSVGDVPEIKTNFIVYGNLGKADVIERATKPKASVKYPDQSSIKVKISDFNIDAVSDFSFSRSINLNPIYAIPKGEVGELKNDNLEPVQIDTQYPIETDINVSIVVDSYEIRQIQDRLSSAPKSDVLIEIRDSLDGSIINEYRGYNVRLVSEAINSSIEEEMSISLTFKGYESFHNQFYI